LVCDRIMTNAGSMPVSFLPGLPAGDFEAIALDLLRDEEVWPRSADGRQKITEIPIERTEPIRQGHDRLAPGVQLRNPIVDVLHIRRFDERVRKELVGGIERMIDLERAAAFRQISGDLNIAIEMAGEPTGCAGHA